MDKFHTSDFEKQVAYEEIERIREAEEDEQNYRKELMARLFGRKLTSRQFGVLFNMPENEQDKEAMIRKNEFRQEKEARDQIRCAEEIIEEMRRRFVIDGTCSEE